MQFASAYYNDHERRSQLNRLVLEVFGLDFGPWNELGFLFDEYTPFTFFEGGRAIANVSASPMQMTLGGQDVMAVQVGTVCTLPNRRKEGLIRELMTRARAHWEGRCGLSFLFANDTVVDFYQQFDYRPVDQHRFHCAAPAWRPATGRARRLDISDPGDLERMRRFADRRAPVSRRAGVRAQAWLWLFHAKMLHASHLVFIEPLELIAVTRTEQDTLHIFDLVGREIRSLEEVYPYLGSAAVREVRFHFTPELFGVSKVIATPAVDAHLFVRGALPSMDGPFLFPATAEA